MMSAYSRRWSEVGVSRGVLLGLFEIAGIPVVKEAGVQTSPHAIERADEFDLHYMQCGEEVCHYNFDPLLCEQDLGLLLRLLDLDWVWLNNPSPYSWVLIHSGWGPIVSRGWDVRRAVVAGIFQLAARRDRGFAKSARVESFQNRFVEDFAFDPRG